MFADRLFHFGLHPPPSTVAQTAQLGAVTLSRVRQFLCAIRGHDLFLHFERRRLSVQCARCGWDSPGWTIDRCMSRPHPSEERPRVRGAFTLASGRPLDCRERSCMQQTVRSEKALVAN